MQTHDFPQGSPEWHAHRAQHFNASDAPAMLGCSPYKTRSQLLLQLHTGLAAEVDGATQRRFDDGHRFEALARPLAEAIIGEELFPVVGTQGRLSASFDGITLAEDVCFEHKTLNDELRAALPVVGPEGNDAAALAKHFRVQMEQQLMVSCAERVLFSATSWSASGELLEQRHAWYYPDLQLRAEITAGWAQLEADLQGFVPAEQAAPVRAQPVEALPAVVVRVDGALTVAGNLDVFGTALRAFVAKIPAKPTTDQEFADCDAACKALKRAEEALDQAEAGALAQISSVEQLQRTVANLRKLARDTRLASEKVVKARKEQLRAEQVLRGRQELAGHVAGLNSRLGQPLMPEVPADFAACISGLKSLDSIANAIDTELARAKIAANEIADRIQANLRTITEGEAAAFSHLFADLRSLVLKAPDDCAAAVATRIAAEKQRQAEVAARIRADEAARLEREQRAAQAVAPAAPAAPAPAVIPLQRATPAPAAGAAPTLKLGQLCERLGFILTADFLRGLGVEPAGRDRAAYLYHEADFERACDALVAHIQSVRAVERRAA